MPLVRRSAGLSDVGVNDHLVGRKDSTISVTHWCINGFVLVFL